MVTGRTMPHPMITLHMRGARNMKSRMCRFASIRACAFASPNISWSIPSYSVHFAIWEGGVVR